MTERIDAFLQYLDEKGKKQSHIKILDWRFEHIYTALKNQPTSFEVIDNLIRSIWSGYVSKDKAVFHFLNEYAIFCEADFPLFTDTFREYVRVTFEGEARKAMRALKNAIVYIPKDTKINPSFLGGLTDEAFIEAFQAWQELIYSIYDDGEHGSNGEHSSPFDWGWPDWSGITWEGINRNRVMTTLDALVCCGHMEDGVLTVDKKSFEKCEGCKPMTNTILLLKRFMDKGFHIEGLEDKKSSVFTVSCTDIPNLITVLYSYFIGRPVGDKNHVRYFSYRFVESPDVQSHETLFLAKTDGEPAHLKEIYFWLYDEAVKHGFTPMGRENIGCYVYKKGTKEWLLLGTGSSYHESDYLHSPNFAIAVKTPFYKLFQTKSEKIKILQERFPDAFGRPWCHCHNCKSDADTCKNRTKIDLENRSYYHCNKGFLYFHDPSFDDVKVLNELYKLEKNITSC